MSIDELLAGREYATIELPHRCDADADRARRPRRRETRCAVTAGEGVNFDATQPFCDLLSSYRFFRDGPAQVPNEGVLPYDLNTPLFSDYARKHRFVWLPPGTSATYNARETFTFPVGALLVKTFAFPVDERDPSLGERLIETRLLLRRATGWEAITYLWNDAQTEATRRVIGKTRAGRLPKADGSPLPDHLPGAEHQPVQGVPRRAQRHARPRSARRRATSTRTTTTATPSRTS